MLEFDVLLLQYLDVSIGSIELNLCILNRKDLVLELTSRLEEVSVRSSVLFLLFLVPLYPHIASLLFSSDDILQVLNPLVKLLLCQIELPLNALLFYFDSLTVALKVYYLLVELFNLLGPLLQGFVPQRDHLLKTLVAFDLVLELYLEVMPRFIHFVQLLNHILVILSGGVQLFLHLVVIYLQRAQLELKFINSYFCRVQVDF